MRASRGVRRCRGWRVRARRTAWWGSGSFERRIATLIRPGSRFGDAGRVDRIYPGELDPDLRDGGPSTSAGPRTAGEAGSDVLMPKPARPAPPKATITPGRSPRPQR